MRNKIVSTITNTLENQSGFRQSIHGIESMAADQTGLLLCDPADFDHGVEMNLISELPSTKLING